MTTTTINHPSDTAAHTAATNPAIEAALNDFQAFVNEVFVSDYYSSLNADTQYVIGLAVEKGVKKVHPDRLKRARAIVESLKSVWEITQADYFPFTNPDTRQIIDLAVQYGATNIDPEKLSNALTSAEDWRLWSEAVKAMIADWIGDSTHFCNVDRDVRRIMHLVHRDGFSAVEADVFKKAWDIAYTQVGISERHEEREARMAEEADERLRRRLGLTEATPDGSHRSKPKRSAAAQAHKQRAHARGKENEADKPKPNNGSGPLGKSGFAKGKKK